MARFFHGTAKPFLNAVKEKGLVPPIGHGRGVRLSRSTVESRGHARAWAAYVLYRERVLHEGMIVICEIPDLSRVRMDSNDVIRAEFVLPSEIRGFLGPLKFPEFGDPTAGGEGPAPPFFAALEEWERLTGRQTSAPFTRRKARRS